MKNEEKIVELLTESLKSQDRLTERLDKTNEKLELVIVEVKNVKTEVQNVKTEVQNVKTEVQNVKTEVGKQNIQTAENTRAILKLAEKFEKFADHEKRIAKLESIVIK